MVFSTKTVFPTRMVFNNNSFNENEEPAMHYNKDVNANHTTHKPAKPTVRVFLRILQTTLLTLALLPLCAVMAEEGEISPRSLDFADFRSSADGGVEIRLALSGPAPTPADFTSRSPAKISLDLSKTKNNLPWSLPLPIEMAGVKSLKASQTADKTRVSINLDTLKPYTIRTEGANIFVNVAGDNSAASDTSGKTTKIAAVQPISPKPQSQPVVEPVKRAAPPRRRTPTGSGSYLKDVSFHKLPGDKVQFVISFSQRAVEPGSFTIDNPARIALDFPNTGSGLGWKNKNVGIGFAKSITAVEAGNRTRVILNLVQLLPFETEVSGSKVYITLAGSRAANNTVPARAATRISTAVPNDDALHSISNIDFRRGNQGEARIVISLSDSDTPASTGESGNLIFVDFGNTSISPNLLQRLDVTDFATPVQYIDTTRVGNRVRLAITPAGDYEYLAYHAGGTYTIEVKPTEKDETATKAKDQQDGYTGEKLSLNFQDIEVRAVLQLIADFTSLNMVTSDSVQGNLTLRLKNVPWDQALDIILKTKGLAMRQSGNVILVAPSAEISAREKLELEAKKQIEELDPLRSDIIQVNYAKASDIAGILQAKGTGVMSERGNTTVDERTNTIIAVDTSERLLDVRKLIARLDIPVRQVMIESRIVIADDTFAKDLGVRFGATGIGNKNTLSTTSGSLEGTDSITDQALPGGPPIQNLSSFGVLNERLNVNLPATPAGGAPGRIALAILGSNVLLDLELSALETDGRGEVISNPRVVTANQQEAVIKQGTQIPFQQASSSGATSVRFKDAVLSLTVTPQITPDDRVILDLAVNKDSVGDIFNGVPSINTKEVKTQVLIENGATVVLGGVYEQSKINSVTKVPFLGDLPFIGALFRSKTIKDTKNELLIFVTPKILKQSLNTNSTQ
ncbi:MAG: type IV pilus secretin PilQ [Gammaproteobacteria bacterium]|nr:type IV pilus secretin PilQ [Gammaproteobacteria bacterium]